MYRCILINRWWLADSLLEKYIRRTYCLDLVWSGAYSEEALQMLKSDDYDLVFASLPSPDRIITEDMLFEFRRQQSLVITASYPEYVFTGYDLNPICFLKEPFPMANFQSAIGKFQNLVSCS
ncbi:hypothetical protein L0657_15810 [Dyadobacter sp. CY345]|uniref:hypothetical protein n=1 Tax=Dyadobacter sp. CY345 TaxID=2909335 RepID=UPI001F4858F4|nr:hypothetical protein [Dyadobacter sp. CY345]MCF2445428.1 hypothetical protein [Dyadobacter sp. CY345]